MKRHYLDCSWGQLHYLEAGTEPGPTVVLLHQVPSSARMWSAVLPEFAKLGYRALALDLPGYGLTDPINPHPGATSLEDYAGAVSEALDLLGIVEPFLVGHHTGAAVSVALATTPGRVKAGALWGIPVLDPVLDKARVDWLVSEPPPDYVNDPLAAITQWWEDRARYTSESLLGEVMPRALLEMLQSGVHRPDGHNASGRVEDWRGLAGAVTCPILAMTGSNEELDVQTRRAVDLYPEIYHPAFFEGLGVDVADEDPAGFVAAVHAFFDPA